jgi:hypothetical protein
VKRWRQNDNSREEWRPVVKEATFLEEHRDHEVIVRLLFNGMLYCRLMEF